MTSKSLEFQREAKERAEQLRDGFTELRDLSARKTAEVLNARGVPTPEAASGTQLRKRLAEK
jgi:hypothetical protein